MASRLCLMRRKTARTWVNLTLADAYRAMASSRSETLALVAIAFLCCVFLVLRALAQQ